MAGSQDGRTSERVRVGGSGGVAAPIDQGLVEQLSQVALTVESALLDQRHARTRLLDVVRGRNREQCVYVRGVVRSTFLPTREQLQGEQKSARGDGHLSDARKQLARRGVDQLGLDA